MLNQVIRSALQYRWVVVWMALATMVFGTLALQSLPIDVLPSLTRPRVVVVSEAHGMAPEEVEQLVTFPIENALNGANGVLNVRSSSDIGLSVVNIEFDWGTDVFRARQTVQERLSLVSDRLPEDVQPKLGPISSLLGQIVLIGLWSEDGTTDPIQIRTLADWNIRPRLRNIPGVSQVITMGGGRLQYQVLVDLHRMHQFEVSLDEIQTALAASNLNVTGGYVDRNSQENLIRGIGRIQSIADIEAVVVKQQEGRPVLLRQVADVREGAQIKRGDSSVNGKDAVVLTIQKQPDADTRQVTQGIEDALDELRASLPPDVKIEITYQQREFVDFAIRNVAEALRDGAILVVIILFLFLLNVRTTFITLTAIPLSILITALVFRFFGLSINVLTLGGIAVAMGELVDDAIVDVENIFRRLRLNAASDQPRAVMGVIYDASVEVRNSIILSTVLVMVVFAPLFALTGMEGRLFTPLGIAYIVSILASTLVSLTVTPALSYFLLGGIGAKQERDSWFLRGLKSMMRPVIRISLRARGLTVILAMAVFGFVASVLILLNMGGNFLPPFDEGAAQINFFTRPGTSLSTSREISLVADQRLLPLLMDEENPDGLIRYFTCRTGRAEEDEHVMGVNVSEYVLSLNAESGVSRTELIQKLSDAVQEIPGVETEVEQPIAHLIVHLLSGVNAQIAIKIFGNDLEELRAKAEQVKTAIEDVPGIAPPTIEQQQITPQYRIEIKRDRLAYYGMSAASIQNFVETALNGQIVTEIVDQQKTIDLMLRFSDVYRTNIEDLHRLPLELPNGQRILLGDVAKIYRGGGPSAINREDGRRRMVVRVNTAGRDLSSVVADIKSRVADVPMSEGYYVTYGGQFEAQESANQRITWLSMLAILVVAVILYSAFPSISIVSQLLFSLPTAFIGGVLALVISGQSMSVAAMVGFISLGGIAARNGLLLISTYIERLPEEGFTQEMILAGSLDRLAPVLMTAFTTGLGLVPLVIGGSLPGKEILFPVATVILGGLITSTFCEFLIRPGLFFFFSQSAAQRLASTDRYSVR